MSCTLYLVRHGIAQEAPAGMSDADRALTADGARKMTRIAAGLRRLGVAPDVVLASPLRRAEETASLLAAALAPDRPVEIYPALAPGHAAAELVRGLQAYRQARRIVLVGHQPDMGQLASFVVSGSTSIAAMPFKKGGVAAIRVASLSRHPSGVLEWFLTPKQLRLIGRHAR
jgi:phosphohistidine phosphatase